MTKSMITFALAVLLGHTQAQQEIALDCVEKVAGEIQDISDELAV